MKQLVTVSSVLFTFAACGDDKPTGTPPDAGYIPDTWPDAEVDAPGTAFMPPTPFAIPISAGGPDQLMSAAPGPSGTFYIAGSTAATAAGARYVFVAKLTAAGALDTNFGTAGVYTSSVEFKGGLDAIDLVVQSTGDIVVAATIESATSATDTDIGLIRVSATGVLDTGFGTSGLARLDLNDNNGTAALGDAQRDLALGPSDVLFVHAAARGLGTASGGGPRTDTDFTVAKLTASGALDTSWGGGDGIFQLDFSNADAEQNATPRGIHALADGSVIAGGYANTPAFNSVQAVLFRLTPTGAPDSNFASGGVFYDTVLAAMTEIYGFAVDGDRITTAGYGRQQAADTNDYVSLRFHTTTGVRDTNFGGAANGAVVVDPSGMMLADNCRDAVALPGGKTALFGSVGAAGSRDAALVILTQNGQLDTTYGDGTHVFSLDGTEDQWWAGAVSGGKLLVAGWKGQTTQSDAVNDDSHGILLTIE